jgi:hypothetical protein
MISSLSGAADGIAQAFSRLEAAASRIASPDATASLPEAAVDLVEAKTAARANMAVLRASDDLLGNLLDVLA